MASLGFQTGWERSASLLSRLMSLIFKRLGFAESVPSKAATYAARFGFWHLYWWVCQFFPVFSRLLLSVSWRKYDCSIKLKSHFYHTSKPKSPLVEMLTDIEAVKCCSIFCFQSVMYSGSPWARLSASGLRSSWVTSKISLFYHSSCVLYSCLASARVRRFSWHVTG